MIEFQYIVNTHRLRYPLMQPQDFAKLAYQSEFGPSHMVTGKPEVNQSISQEWKAVSCNTVPCNPEPIGGGLCRFHMTDSSFSMQASANLAQLFIQTANEYTGTREGLLARLAVLSRMQIRGMDAWIQRYKLIGMPLIRHSEPFRTAYHPHYRLLREAYAKDLYTMLTTGHFPAEETI